MELLLFIVTAFTLSHLSIKILIPLAMNVGLVDKPNERKLHTGNIPLIGGISIFIAVLTASYILLPNTLELRMYLIASAMMVFIGALDDKYDLSVEVRIIGQIIVASLLIYGLNGFISSFGNIFGFGNVDIGLWGILFTYFAIIVMINAFNMVDGIDGLVGCLSINTFVSIAVLFLMSNQEYYIGYPLIISAAIIPYLLYNLGIFKKPVNKIFMGDAGSMFIGLSVIWLLTMGTQGDQISFRPVTALWICAIPVLDMLTVVLRRIKAGKSPLKPDRDHLHHLLLNSGLSTYLTLTVIIILSILLSAIGILCENYKIPGFIMLPLFIMLFLIYYRMCNFLLNKRKHSELSV